MGRRGRLVSTAPERLSPGDRIRIFNASQPLWASILGVTANAHWVYLRIESGYVPDPYVVRVAARQPVVARKIAPWRTAPPEEAGNEARGAIPVRTSLTRKERRSVTQDSWGRQQRKQDRWINNNPRPRRRRWTDEDIGFIPDPTMEARRQRKAQRKKEKKKEAGTQSAGLLAYYRILGCKAGNRLSTIKKRFKKLALEHHPDRNPDDPEAEERFKRINDAYIRISKALSK